jgi:hypothetical protein
VVCLERQREMERAALLEQQSVSVENIIQEVLQKYLIVLLLEIIIQTTCR